jgi:hypothetical protein
MLSITRLSPLDFLQIDGDVMSHSRSEEQSLPATAETRLGVVRTAERVGEATRQAALERAGSAPSIADRGPGLPDAIHHVASSFVSAEAEIERFRMVLGARHRAHAVRLDADARRDTAAPFAAFEQRTTCHGESHRPTAR